MSEISKEIAYLKGLAEGMNISDKSDEGKLIGRLIDVLADAADEIDALWNRNDELETRLLELDEEIYAAEMDIDTLYDDLEDALRDDELDIMDYDDEYEDEDDDFLDMYDEDDDLFEIMCPECGEDVVVDFDMLDEENNIVCPNCHRDIELEFDMDEDDSEEE